MHNQDIFIYLIPTQFIHHGISRTNLIHAPYSSRLQDTWTILQMVQHQKNFVFNTLFHVKGSGGKRGAVKLTAIQQAEYMKNLLSKVQKNSWHEVRLVLKQWRYSCMTEVEKVLADTQWLLLWTCSTHYFLEISSMDITMTGKDFLTGFKQSWQDLTFSPSGHHPGHYKAELGEPDLCAI